MRLNLGILEQMDAEGGGGPGPGPGGGGFPVLASVSYNEDTGAYPLAAIMPATVNADDLLIMLITQGSGDDPNTTPAGWSQLVPGDPHAFYKWADGTEDGDSVNIGSSGSAAACFTVLRIIEAEGQNPEGAIDTLNSSSTPNPPALNPTWPDANNLFIVYAGTSEPETIAAWPGTYTDHRTANSGTEGSSFVATRDRSLSTSENPDSFSLSSTTPFSRAITIAVRGT